MRTANRSLRGGTAALAAVLLASLLQLLVATPALAHSFDNRQVADQARSYALGSFGDECRVFAGNVVNAVLRRHGLPQMGGYYTPGGTYYGAYERAGGVQVPVAEAQPGDLIQTIRTGEQHRDFPSSEQGLHTAIVVERRGPGSYVVRDSNWVSRHTVGEHEWTPESWARERGATAYAWRFGTVPPQVVDPGWVQVPGWASDVAIATISGGWQMFHVGGNGTIYRRKAQHGTSTGWQAISGPRAKRIAVTTSSDGRVELFYIGMNDAVYHHWERTPGGDISSWEALGGRAKEITAARSGNRWEVFVVGGDNAIYRATQSRRAWQRMAGTWAHGLAAATSRDGRVELFHIGGGRNVFHAWQSSPGSGFGAWHDRGGWKTAIGATSVGNGEFELFAIGGSSTIWRSAPWSGVGGWQQLAGGASRVAAARHPDGRVELLVVNGSGRMFHSWQKAVGRF